jgi:hypothetical protein
LPQDALDPRAHVCESVSFIVVDFDLADSAQEFECFRWIKKTQSVEKVGQFR